MMIPLHRVAYKFLRPTMVWTYQSEELIGRFGIEHIEQVVQTHLPSADFHVAGSPLANYAVSVAELTDVAGKKETRVRLVMRGGIGHDSVHIQTCYPVPGRKEVTIATALLDCLKSAGFES